MKEISNAIIRLIVSAVLLINASLTAKGINPIPFDENAFAEVATYIAAGLGALWAWWKDNNVTKKAVARKDVTKKIVNGEIAIIEPEEIEDVEDTVDLETEYEKEAK